jgi:hypothetical protein
MTRSGCNRLAALCSALVLRPKADALFQAARLGRSGSSDSTYTLLSNQSLRCKSKSVRKPPAPWLCIASPVASHDQTVCVQVQTLRIYGDQTSLHISRWPGVPWAVHAQPGMSVCEGRVRRR